MFYPMEEQATHITRLMEENRRYIREHGKLKKTTSACVTPSAPASSMASPSPSSSSSSRLLSTDNYSSDEYGNPTNQNYDPSAPTDLRDRVMALQLQNSELNVCLERERRRRREAEEKVVRDESYIKRLEDSVQILRGTRVVMDPATYRQLAEAYITSRRPPARRPHTHTHTSSGGDLVCDDTHHRPIGQRMSMPVFPQTSSCPSSPKSSSSSSSSSSTSSSYDDSQLFNRTSGRSKKERRELVGGGVGVGVGVGGVGVGGVMGLDGNGASMNPWDYQQLLESLEDLDGGSRGALS